MTDNELLKAIENIIDTKFDGFETKVNVKFDEMDAKIDNLEGMMDTKIENLEGKIYNEISKLATKEDLDKSEYMLLAEIKYSADSIRKEIRPMKNDIVILKSRNNVLDAYGLIKDLELRVTELESKVS